MSINDGFKIRHNLQDLGFSQLHWWRFHSFRLWCNAGW